MVAAGVRHLLVLDNDELVGVLSARDLTREGWPDGLTRPADGSDSGPLLGDIVGRKPVSIDSDMPIRAAALIMSDLEIGCLPIVDDGVPTGIVTRTDIVRVLASVLSA